MDLNDSSLSLEEDSPNFYFNSSSPQELAVNLPAGQLVFWVKGVFLCLANNARRRVVVCVENAVHLVIWERGKILNHSARFHEEFNEP